MFSLRMILPLFVLGFLPLSVFSQSLKTINVEEIPQRKIRKYIVSREIDQMPDFSSIHASWKKDINASDFNFNEKIYNLKYRLSNVWDCYRHANPSKAWNGRSVRFGLLISKYSNSVSYTNNSFFPEVDTGQVYFLNLRLIRGLFNVPVAFEIITIDNQQQIMEFSYIDNNKSRGKQSIQFFDAGEGHTRIVHRSYFKSKSSLRDDLIYPYFHKKFINEFHRNMKHLVKDTAHTVTIL